MKQHNDTASHIGKLYGNYRLLRLLGSGGFAKVYLGEHIYLSTRAAVKLLHVENANMERFLSEARLIARLQHPHIISVLEFDIVESTPFLVMEYVPNGTLRQQIAEGSRLPLPHIASSARQIASALQYIHDQGLIHGDVKPENILLGPQKELLLSDFGLAGLAEQQAQGNMLVGTVEYMAPEQLQHQFLPACDQYALGIMVYEWITGYPPFTGSYIEIATQHALTPPPSFKERTGQPLQAIEGVIQKALAKDPCQRFARVADFVDALEYACRHDQAVMQQGSSIVVSTVPSVASQQPVTSSIPRRRVLQGALGGVVLALAGGGAFAWWVASHQQPSRQTAPVKHITPTPTASAVGTLLYTYRGHSAPVSALAWSLDGKRIASGSGTPPGYDQPSNASPDEHTVRVWDALSGTHVVTYDGHSSAIMTVAWSPDGKRIASAGYGQPQVHVWDAATGQRIATYSGGTGAVDLITWADGASLVLTNDDGTIRNWKPADSSSTYLYDSAGNPLMARISPDGKFLVRETGQGFEVLQLPALTSVSVFTHGIGGAVGIVWSPDSTRILTETMHGSPYVWQAANGELLVEFKGDFQEQVMNWSPNGKYIASVGDSRKLQVWESGTGNVLLSYTNNIPAIKSIAWSSDSQLVAFGDQTGVIRVWKAR
ncbi:MAG: protein kinase [Ktedonobacteraceae bacterium]|nr:protein kinase [Ktedonobacteraceae bacterium]